VPSETKTHAVLRGNRIHDGASTGIFIYDCAKADIENNTIYSNLDAGVDVQADATAVLSGNRIYDGKTEGVFIGDKARVTLDDNVITSNDCEGTTACPQMFAAQLVCPQLTTSSLPMAVKASQW
jgi:parallel beta-helix repeat protein